MKDSTTLSINYSVDSSTFIRNLESLSSLDDCIVLIIENCPSTAKASELISYEWFWSLKQRKIPSLFAIRLKIDSNVELQNTDRPKQHEFITKSRNDDGELKEKTSFLVSFENTNGSGMIIYWRNFNSKEFLKLQIIEDSILPAVKIFTLNYIIDALKAGYLITLSSDNETDLASLTSRYFKNPLLYAVIDDNLMIVKELLKLPFDVNEEVMTPDGETIIDYAKDDTIKLELLKANSVWPKKFNEYNTTPEIKEFLKINTNMHFAIEMNDLDKVTIILRENPHLRYFFKPKNFSAFKCAFENKRTAIYKLLAEHNVTFGPNEEINNDDDDFGDMICGLNSQLSQNVSNVHIFILMSRSVIPHGDSNLKQRTELVKKAFETIDKVPEISLQLQTIITSKKVKIHFDFMQSSVMYMDPTMDKYTRGLFYAKTHHLHISAKRLLDENVRNEAYGTISHESSHCCMHLIFRNVRLPFAIDDDVNRKRFMEIIDECERLKEHELIINGVYYYNKDAYGRELIVRVPQLLSHYQDDEVKITQLKQTFKSLFDYYDEVVMTEMRLALPVLQKLSNDSTEIKFYELTKPLKAAILHSYVDFQGVEVQLKDIADEIVLNKLTSKQIRNILDGEIENIGKKLETGNEIYINRDFLTSDMKIRGDEKTYDYSSDEDDETVIDIPNKGKSVTRSLETIMNRINNSKVCLISDQAGAGKSTTLKHLSEELKKNNPNYYVCYIDLKQHLKVYEEFEKKLADMSMSKEVKTKKEENSNQSSQSANKQKHSQKFTEDERNQQKTFLLEVLRNILQPTTDLDYSIFMKLFNSNQLILLFDAVDEIAPKFKEFFLKLIKNIKELTKNQQWITTRPQHANEIKTKLRCKAYELVPFDSIKIAEFIKKFLELQNCSEIDQKVTEISEICKSLKYIDNPLMLKMIVELHVNGKIEIKSLNQYELYKEMMKMKLDILTEEKGPIANRDRNPDSKMTPEEVHQVYALLLIIQDGKFENYSTPNQDFYININELALFKKWKRQKKNWTTENITRYGILVVDHWNTENEQPEFVHRTFAEYFMTQFLIEIIEESLESDGDVLSEKQFDLNMKMAFYIISNYCMQLTNTEGLWSYIMGYLSVRNINTLTFGEPFLNLLISNEIKGFIVRMMKKSYKIIRILLSVLKLPQFFDYIDGNQKFSNENIFKSLLLVDENQSKMFQNVFLDPKGVIECVELFTAIKNSGLNKWHLMTDFDHNLTVKQLNEITFSQDNDDFLYEVQYKDNESYQFVNRNEKELSKSLKLFFQFILIADDIPLVNLQIFLSKITRRCALLILKSQTLIELLFKVAKKYFQESSVDCLQILTSFFKGLKDENPKLSLCIENSTFLLNLNYFFENISDILRNLQIEEIEEFLNNSFDFILYKALFCHETIIEKVYEIFKSPLIDSEQKFQDILKRSVRFKRFEQTFGGFQFQESALMFLCSKLKNYDMIESISNDKILSYWYSHPLFAAINNNTIQLLEYFHKILSVEDVLNIFYMHIGELVRYSYLQAENFSQFFKIFFNSHHSTNFIEKSNDDVVETINIGTDDFFKEHSPKSKVVFQILNFMSQVDHLNKKIYFKNTFWAICWISFPSQLTIEKIFEVFEKHFSDDKMSVLQLIRNAFNVRGLFNTNDLSNKILSTEFRKNIDFFWLKVEEFFSSDPELLRNILLGHYEYNHPLILSIYYNFENLNNLYLKYFKIREILNMFFGNSNSITIFYDAECFETFFRQKILSTTEGKNELKSLINTIESENENPFENIIGMKANLIEFFSFLIQEIFKNETLTKEPAEASSSKIKSDEIDSRIMFNFCLRHPNQLSPDFMKLLFYGNLRDFLKFALKHDMEISEEIYKSSMERKIQISMILSESSTYNHLSLECKTLSNLRRNIKNFFKYAFDHDPRALNGILNVRIFEVQCESFTIEPRNVLAFKFFYRKMIENLTDTVPLG